MIYCRHCKTGPPHRRGLCWTCFHTGDIRALYAPKYTKPNETMEDIEAMIAEQMQNLPKWWNKGWKNR